MNPQTVRLPMVIAHRGACAYAPENTLAAFILAAEQGAQAIELDAKLSLDEIVVVHHDFTLERTTNGSGPLLAQTAAQLQALDAGSKFHPDFAGEPIPTLAEVFETVGERVLINVELTNYAAPRDRLVEETVKLVRQYGLQDRVIFSSFLPQNLWKAGKLLPETKRAILAQPGARGWLMRTRLLDSAGRHAVHPYYSDVTPQTVARDHARGRTVNPWTMNEPEELRRLCAANVDGLITDDPLTALEVVRQFGEQATAAGHEVQPVTAW